MLVFGALGSFVSYRYYNKRQSTRILDEFKQRAAHIANETVQPLEQVRKVKVYVSPSPGELGNRKGLRHWNEYILPVFAAGALDYDLVVVSDTDESGKPIEGSVHSKVCGEIVEYRRRLLEDTNPALKDMVRENRRRQYVNENGGREPAPADLEDDKSNWSEVGDEKDLLDMVAIGRHTFAEVVNGVVEGFTTTLNTNPTAAGGSQLSKGSDSDNDKSEDARSGVEEGLLPNVAPASKPEEPQQWPSETDAKDDNTGGDSKLPMLPIEYDEYARHESVTPKVPTLGYIAHYNYTGWSSLPIRFWHFVNDQENVRFYGKQALDIVLNAKRPWRTGDEYTGSGEESMNG
ncbi:mitochondrial import inner membrane translocase subunit tim54, partial [Spiromyces aspiralis]